MDMVRAALWDQFIWIATAPLQFLTGHLKIRSMIMHVLSSSNGGLSYTVWREKSFIRPGQFDFDLHRPDYIG